MKSLSGRSRSSGTAVRISWHPAFFEALQMELYDYRDALEFHSEYQLTAEPLRIDCVVIRKAKDVEIKKNIAAVFREWNLFEYKNPGDYVSVADFYKVYGYACLYASFRKVPVTGLSVSFVESRYPKKLIKHLRNKRGYTVAETAEGIYTIKGDILPMQVIDSRRLPAEENLWLKSLTDELNLEETKEISEEMARQDKAAPIAAYRDAVIRANPGIIQEAFMGKRSSLTIEQVIENVGLGAKWEARAKAEGEARGRIEGKAEQAFAIAQNLVNLGLPFETVVSATRLEPEKVKALYRKG
jgi:hypothetical protein